MGVAQIMLDDLDLSNIVIGWYKLFGTTSLVSGSTTLSRRSSITSFDSIKLLNQTSYLNYYYYLSKIFHLINFIASTLNSPQSSLSITLQKIQIFKPNNSIIQPVAATIIYTQLTFQLYFKMQNFYSKSQKKFLLIHFSRHYSTLYQRCLNITPYFFRLENEHKSGTYGPPHHRSLIPKRLTTNLNSHKSPFPNIHILN